MAFVNDEAVAKGRDTFSIWKGHMDNFTWLSDNRGIAADVIILFASNCMFVRALHLDGFGDRPAICPGEGGEHLPYGWNNRQRILKNPRIIDVFRSQGIPLTFGQHEGLTIEWNTMEKVVRFCREHDLEGRIDHQCVFEEVLPHSLAEFYTGRRAFYICRMLWERPSPIHMDSLDWILDGGGEGEAPGIPDWLAVYGYICAIKPIMRRFDDPLRARLRELADGYHGC